MFTLMHILMFDMCKSQLRSNGLRIHRLLTEGSPVSMVLDPATVAEGSVIISFISNSPHWCDMTLT